MHNRVNKRKQVCTMSHFVFPSKNVRYVSKELKIPIFELDTNYSRSGGNQMWILKNSKTMLEYIQSRSLSSCNSTKTFDFSTLYTAIPHSKLKDRLRELLQLYCIK